MQGNVLDMAVGVVIGGAFKAIIDAMVEFLINPLIGMFVQTEALSTLTVQVGSATFGVGALINAIINFIIIAFVLFIVVKTANNAKRLRTGPVEEEAPTTKVCPFCKSEIPMEATRCPHCTSQLEEVEKVLV